MATILCLHSAWLLLLWLAEEGSIGIDTSRRGTFLPKQPFPSCPVVSAVLRLWKRDMRWKAPDHPTSFAVCSDIFIYMSACQTPAPIMVKSEMNSVCLPPLLPIFPPLQLCTEGPGLGAITVAGTAEKMLKDSFVPEFLKRKSICV